MSAEKELEHRVEIADAKLGVAEDLGWIIGLLAGLVVYLKWQSWFLAIPTVPVIYFLVTYRFRKDSDHCEDEYHRAAGIGRYSRQQQPPAA